MKKKSLNPGDRVYARLMLNGRMIAEFAGECLSGLTEIICALRYRTRSFRGLAKLYIRNLSGGWSEERPLMLYPPQRPAFDRDDFNTAFSASATAANDAIGAYMAM